MTDFYRAVSDPVRRHILRLVAHQEQTQSQLVEQFTISQPAVKKHLAILMDEGLIQERREGRYCYYRLNRSVYQQQYERLKEELGLLLENKLSNLKQWLEEESEDGSNL